MRLFMLILAPALCGACSSEIVHGLSETQANQVTSVLAEQGVPAEKARDEGAKGERWTVAVGRDDKARAIAIMRENGLPKSSGRGLADVFPKSSLIPTPTEERAMMMQAVMGELERTLETIDGVTLARVHVVVPGDAERGARGGAAPSAAVLLKTRPGAVIDRAAVRRLVVHGGEGLAAERVTVELFEGTARHGGSTAPLHRIGPVLVHPASVGPLRAAAGVAAAAVALLGLAVALLVLRVRTGRAVGEAA